MQSFFNQKFLRQVSFWLVYQLKDSSCQEYYQKLKLFWISKIKIFNFIYFIRFHRSGAFQGSQNGQKMKRSHPFRSCPEGGKCFLYLFFLIFGLHHLLVKQVYRQGGRLVPPSKLVQIFAQSPCFLGLLRPRPLGRPQGALTGQALGQSSSILSQEVQSRSRFRFYFIIALGRLLTKRSGIRCNKFPRNKKFLVITLKCADSLKIYV